MHKPNRYQFLYGNSQGFQISLSDTHIKLLKNSRMVIIAIACFALFLATWGLYQKIDYIQARNSNQNLQKRASYLRSIQHQQANSLSEIINLSQNLYNKYGFQNLGIEVAQMGIGGPRDKRLLLERHTNPNKELLFQIDESTATIERQIEFSRTDLTNLQSNLEQKINSWKHLPTAKPAEGRYTSGYGYRTHPVTGLRKLHHGLDIANEKWTPIHATADGIIKYVRKGPHFGNYVVIDHLNSYVTRFGHMAKTVVKPGQTIKRYEVIGYMGNTGRSTGTHLHYEILQNNISRNPRNFILPRGFAVD